MRKVIKHVLDQILDLPPPNLPPQEALIPEELAEPAPDLAISSMFTGDEPEFLEWLNSVDWTRDILQDNWT